MPRKKRKGDPFLYDYEKQIVLDALQTLKDEWDAKFGPTLQPHASLGSMFSSIQPSNVHSMYRTPAFTAQDLVDRFPRRFTAYTSRDMYWWRKAHGELSYKPSIYLRTILKRLSEDGKLVRREDRWRRRGGKVTYTLKAA